MFISIAIQAFVFIFWVAVVCILALVTLRELFECHYKISFILFIGGLTLLSLGIAFISVCTINVGQVVCK